MFTYFSLSTLLEPLITRYDWLYITLGLLALIWLGAFVFTLIQTSIAMESVDKYTIWHNQFNDEYFNHINNKGYKCAFDTSCFFLIFFSVFGQYFQEFLVTLSFSDFAEFILGLIFISYSLTVLILLRGEDE